MKKFLCRLLFFLIPFYFVGLFIGFVYYIGWTTGEFADFSQLIEMQRQDHNIFIGMGYNEQTAYYKLENANYYQADVITLGTSRVMQFKNEYFDSDFYNCGGAVGWNYDEYLNFVKNLNYTPRMIIIGLDQWVFNDAWNQYCIAYDNEIPIGMIDRNSISMEWSMIKDLLSCKWNVYAIENYPMNYGVTGRSKGVGFQWDGSYYSGNVYREPTTQEDYMFVITFERIDGGYGFFEWGEHIDDKTCGYLKAFLEYCKENGIMVIGFAPPFAPSVYNRMIASGNYSYLSEISPKCEEIFQQYGYEYYDYTDVSILNVGDAYFVDGYHGGEVAYAYIVEDMLAQGSCLREYVDEKQLEELLSDCYSELLLKDFVHGE